MKKLYIMLSLYMILAFGMTAYGAESVPVSKVQEYRYVEGGTLTKTVILPAGQVTLIPRYEEDGDTLYILDEASVSIKAGGKASAEGTEVITVTETMTGLPDNDLKRIPMTKQQGKITCKLLYVTYKITATDEYKIPCEYEAFCYYGGLEKYSVDYDASWEATMTYTGHPIDSDSQSGRVEYIYESESFPAQVTPERERTGDTGRGIQENSQKTEPEEATTEQKTVPEETTAEQKTAEETIKPTEEALEREPEMRIIEEEEIPLSGPERNSFAAIVAVILLAICVFIAVFLYVYLFTAPIYAAIYSGGYKRIGRIFLRRKKDHYRVILSEYLMEKAEIDTFKIKISRYIKNRSGANILEIRCPDGHVITQKLKSEVIFSLID